MNSKKPNIRTEDTFEAGLDRLKKIVQSLEKSDISLDDALNGFEEGIKLSRILSDKLTQAEARLEQLTKGANGKPEVSPMNGFEFSHEEEEEDE